jgi:hypothetical protein
VQGRDSVVLRSFFVPRAFLRRRTTPTLCFSAALLLQRFINRTIKLAMDSGLATGLPQILVPENINNCLSHGPDPDHTLVPIHASGGGLWDFSALFRGDELDADAVREGWKHLALQTHGSLGSDLMLSSTDMEHAELGDMVAFCLLHLQMYRRGVFAGLAFLLLRQFGDWLAMALPQFLNFYNQVQIPELRGTRRHLRNDPRCLVTSSPGDGSGPAIPHKADDANKTRVYAYCQAVSDALAQALTRTRTFVSDGWRGSGEAMELFFVYSPELDLGGYLPFQVPCPPAHLRLQTCCGLDA